MIHTKGTITLKSVTKKYELLKKRPLLLKSIFLHTPKPYKYALKKLDLHLKQGDSLGIIGHNGSGKSTLLKLISGITTPSSGMVAVQGKVSSLIEISAGFIPDMTAYENIILNACLMGYDQEILLGKIQAIIDYSELSEVIHEPLRTYSSGMVMRLGFSIAINFDPDILLVDEILAVGDGKFQAKCIHTINSLKCQKKTIVFISHNLGLINSICDSCLWMDNGRIIQKGKTSEVLAAYSNALITTSSKSVNPTESRWGSGKSKIIKVEMVSSRKKDDTLFESDKFQINLKIKFFETIKNPVFGITISDSDLKTIFSTNTILKPIGHHIFSKGDIARITFNFNTAFPEGVYFISPAVASTDTKEFYDWWDCAMKLVVKRKIIEGTFAPDHAIQLI